MMPAKSKRDTNVPDGKPRTVDLQLFLLQFPYHFAKNFRKSSIASYPPVLVPLPPFVFALATASRWNSGDFSA